MPNFSSLAGLEVASLIRSGFLDKDNKVAERFGGGGVEQVSNRNPRLLRVELS